MHLLEEKLRRFGVEEQVQFDVGRLHKVCCRRGACTLGVAPWHGIHGPEDRSI